jgi:molybdate transport system substrate-binding protein
LTVFAAASLGRVLEDATAAYESSHPGVTVTVSTGSSTALRTQIEQGAPADLLLSADTANPKALVDDGLAPGPPVDFARNLLTVVVPAANPAGIRGPADLARTGVRVVAAGDGVPITKYATQVVASLARQPGYPADFAARYAANIVSHEDDVAAVVAKVSLGEGDAAIVYVTDAAGASGIEAIPIPAAANAAAAYAGVVVGGSRQADEARAFLDWFTGADGRAILGRFGFLPPS